MNRRASWPLVVLLLAAMALSACGPVVNSGLPLERAGVAEPARLNALIQRAHAHGIRVVVWYLPTLTDVNADMTRLMAIAGLGVEGLSVDIESREVSDPAERSRRLVDLSNRLRAALPGRTLGAIVFPPTGMEVINPSYWPGFPWDGIAHDYDVWLPMAYWTGRTLESGWK